ncbi:MAG: phosphorylase [Cyanobacteriota bacterium]|nr:phosphorylase [Cyanobacteriota bacterium]
MSCPVILSSLSQFPVGSDIVGWVELGAYHMKIAVILGSNSDVPAGAWTRQEIPTDYGLVPLWQSPSSADPQHPQLALLLRHGEQHELLPHLVNFRGNFWALKHWGCQAIVSFSVMGVLQAGIPLTRPILFDDIFFPSNQLPDGSACTLFDQPAQAGRGHFLVEHPCSPTLRAHLRRLLPHPIEGGIYGHVFGPRFSTRSELTYLQKLGITAISQTSGPEFVLAGELGIPYALVGFGVDYADPDPGRRSSLADLNQNLRQWSLTLPQIVQALLTYDWPAPLPFDQGYFYHIEHDLPRPASIAQNP